jgi:hypothetical protein
MDLSIFVAMYCQAHRLFVECGAKGRVAERLGL